LDLVAFQEEAGRTLGLLIAMLFLFLIFAVLFLISVKLAVHRTCGRIHARGGKKFGFLKRL
jgi:hypothetical protein